MSSDYSSYEEATKAVAEYIEELNQKEKQNQEVKIKKHEKGKEIYGTFDGRTTKNWGGNREERRKAIKRQKNMQGAKYCIYCKNKTLSPTDDFGTRFCDCCGRVKEE